MAHLTLAFLGPPEVRHNDHLLTFPTRKALALLIYLAVEGGMQPREKLATLFWPESRHKAGRASLRTTLALLRKELAHADASGERPHLRVERDAIGFNPAADYELDLTSVQRALDRQSDNLQVQISTLQAAVVLHRGEFLEGFSLPDTPQFDEWVSFQQEQWHLRLSQIFDQLAQLQMKGGETAAAIATLNRWLALNPLEERAYRRLMRAYMTLGDRPGALQAYEKCEAVLMAELGVEPAPETAALAEQIRTAKDAGRRVKDEIRLSSSAFISPPLTLPLVGRAEEHSRLVAAYHHAQHGRFRISTIEGEAGIGKTSLARHFLNWAAAQGATILRGRAFETGGRLPYQPIVDALRPIWQAGRAGAQRDGGAEGQRSEGSHVKNVPSATANRSRHHLVTLSPTWLAELSRLLPGLRDAYPDLPSPTADEAIAQTRLFEAVARLGQSLSAEMPLVLFIDDVQWADAASLDLLQYAARRWVEADSPIMLLFGLRSEALARADRGQTDSALREWLASLGRDLPLTRLELTSLSAPDTQQLVTSLGVSPAQVESLAEWLFSETGGQPFYLAETINALIDADVLVRGQDGAERERLDVSAEEVAEGGYLQPGFMPPGLREVLCSRLARLSADAFNLLAAGATLGQAFGYRQLCRVSGVAADAGLAALDELLAAYWLVEAETDAERPYLFAHDKIRDVVYTEAGDARRRLFHERAYLMLKETGTAAAQIAHHALVAGLVEPAFEHSLAAGDNAMELFAVRDAVEQYEQARTLLKENPSLKGNVDPAQIHYLYRRLGRGYELVNAWDAAEAVYTEMLSDARRMAWPEMEVAALNRLATIKVLWQLDPESALSILEEARTVAEAGHDRRGLAETEWNACLSKFYRFERPAALEHGERAIALAREIGDRELIAKCLNATGYAAAGVNLWGKVEEYGEEAHTLYADMGNRALDVDSLLLVTFARINIGRPASGVEVARRALRISREIENEWGEANSLNHLAAGLLDLGAYGEALNSVQKVFALPQIKDAPQYMAAFTVRGMVYRALQDFEQALADHVRADEHIHRLGNPGMLRVVSAHLCADYAYLGQWDKAYELAQVAMQTKDFGWYYAGFHYWMVIEALLHGGDEAAAESDIATLAEAVERFPRYRIIVERSRAALKKWRGDVEGAISHLEIALRQAEALSLPGEQWPVLAALAELAEERGEEETAVALRRQSRDIINFIAGQIDDSDLREGFVGRTAVRNLRDET